MENSNLRHFIEKEYSPKWEDPWHNLWPANDLVPPWTILVIVGCTHKCCGKAHTWKQKWMHDWWWCLGVWGIWRDAPHLKVESSLHYREGRRFPLYSMFPKIHSPGSLMVPIYSTFQLSVPFKPSIPTSQHSNLPVSSMTNFHSNLPTSLPSISFTQTFHFNLLTFQHPNLPVSSIPTFHSNLPPLRPSNIPPVVVTEWKFQPDNPLHRNTTYSRSTVYNTGPKKAKAFLDPWLNDLVLGRQ